MQLTSHSTMRWEIIPQVYFGDRDSKVHGANMGPIWGRQEPGGPYVGPMNFAIWGWISEYIQPKDDI